MNYGEEHIGHDKEIVGRKMLLSTHKLLTDFIEQNQEKSRWENVMHVVMSGKGGSPRS